MRNQSLPLWKRRIPLPALFLFVSPGLEQANVFNYSGPDFLTFFLWFAIGVFVLAEVLRRLLIKSIPPVQRMPAPSSTGDPYELAFLAGSGPLAVNAAVASLCQSGNANLTAKGELKLLKPVGELATANSLEGAIARACVSPNGTPLKEIRPQARAWLEETNANLEERGLVYPREGARTAVLWPLLLALLVPGVGLIKIVVGLSRGRPVAFLVLGVILTLIFALARFTRRPFRTPAGESLLASLRSENDVLKYNPLQTSVALPLAIALFGLPVLEATPYGQLRKALSPSAGEDGVTSFGSSCGGSCGGGGGCGGGGCGGCGGS